MHPWKFVVIGLFERWAGRKGIDHDAERGARRLCS